MNSRTGLLCIAAIAAFIRCGGTKAADQPKPEIWLSQVVPVAGRELEIRLWNEPEAKGEALLTVTHEGKEVLSEKLAAVEGKFTKKWTPGATGYYTASFDLQGSGLSGKATLDFPVVVKDIYFVVWPPLKRGEKDLRNLASYVVCGKEDIPYWTSRGSKALAYVSGVTHREQQFAGKTDDEVVRDRVERWSKPIKEGFDGIFIDEFGEFPTRDGLNVVEICYKALTKFHAENPKALIFPNISGAPLREESITTRYADAVAILETFPTCFVAAWGTHDWRQHLDYRIMVTKNTDAVWEKGGRFGTIIELGTGACGGGLLIPELEDDIRYIKKKAPEMPGIAFMFSGREWRWATESGVRRASDELAEKYYVKPVIDLREMFFSDYSPAVGQNVDVYLRVHNLGGMDAKDVKVRFFAVRSGTNEKRPIGGEVTINKVGTGWVEENLPAKAAEKEPMDYYEYKEVDGNTYPIFQTKSASRPRWQGTPNTIWVDRHVVKVTWKPQEEGYYTVIAEAVPSDGFTLLDGVTQKSIVVKAK